MTTFSKSTTMVRLGDTMGLGGVTPAMFLMGAQSHGRFLAAFRHDPRYSMRRPSALS
jgi:hypothetical protein